MKREEKDLIELYDLLLKVLEQAGNGVKITVELHGRKIVVLVYQLDVEVFFDRRANELMLRLDDTGHHGVDPECALSEWLSQFVDLSEQLEWGALEKALMEVPSFTFLENVSVLFKRLDMDEKEARELLHFVQKVVDGDTAYDHAEFVGMFKEKGIKEPVLPVHGGYYTRKQLFEFAARLPE
jgi:hypothetical protein